MSIALWIYAAIATIGGLLWLLTEERDQVTTHPFAAIGRTLAFALLCAPLFVIFVILVNLCEALRFTWGSRKLLQLK